MSEETPLEPPLVSTVKETHETVTTKGSTDPAPTPAPVPAADDNARKWLALAVIVQFVVVVGYWIYLGKAIDNIQMVLGAEIAFVSSVLNYYFGSSSGSTAKSQATGK